MGTSRSRSLLAALLLPSSLAACASPERAAPPARVQHVHDVHALAGVTRLAGDLVLERAALTDLRGLAIEAVTGDVVIRGNVTLESLEGLERLRSIGGRLVVEKNPRLTSLFELAALREVGGDVRIDGNAALSPCEAAALRAQLGRGDGSEGCDAPMVVDAR